MPTDSYHAAGLIDHEGDIPPLLWPKIACAVFALELYLKCLHRVRRRYIEGHNVQHLFAALSAADRTRITDIYSDAITKHPHFKDFIDNGLLVDIDSVLQSERHVYQGPILA